MTSSRNIAQPLLFDEAANVGRPVHAVVGRRHFGNMHGEVMGGKDEWLTPPWIIEALGRFDLDPCAPIERPWDTAEQHYTLLDDGLAQPWRGRVWLNPPYGRETWKWIARLAAHGRGTALTFARTETNGFHSEVWGKATGLLFFRGRLAFYNLNGVQAEASAGAPSCLAAYGAADWQALQKSGIDGYLVALRGEV